MKDKTEDIFRQVANIMFAITQILAGYFFQLSEVGASVAEQSRRTETPVIPAGYAFSIWGLIFFFSLSYAIYQALPSKRNNELLRSIGFWTAGAFLFNTIWEVVAQAITFNWPTAVIIIFILIFSLGALLRLLKFKSKLSKTEKWLVWVPVGVLAGWVSAATFANISSVLNQLEFGYFGMGETNFSIGMICIAALFASSVLYKTKGDVLYGLTIIWALVAIVMANIYRTYNIPVAVFTAAMAVAVIAVMIFFRNSYAHKESKS